MGYSKKIPVGSNGSLDIEEAAGMASVSFSLSETSGGSIEGIVLGSVSAKVQVDAKSLIDVGLDLIKAKYPSADALLTGLQAIIDAEVATL